MIIDCHGHYTTTPPAVEAYRNAQKEILKTNPDHIFEKGEIILSDDEIRLSIEQNQLKNATGTWHGYHHFFATSELDGSSCW